MHFLKEDRQMANRLMKKVLGSGRGRRLGLGGEDEGNGLNFGILKYGLIEYPNC